MTFDLDMSSPFPPGASDGFLGGPGQGGHVGPDWFIWAGMDLGAPGGTEVRAIFDGKITKVDTSNVDVSTGKVFGAQVFVRAEKPGELDADDPDGVGVFYTHIRDLPPEIQAGGHIARGQVIGRVVAALPPHLHCAIAERRGGTNFGVDLYAFFQCTINDDANPTAIRFLQDGSPPQPQISAGGPTGLPVPPSDATPEPMPEEPPLEATIG